MQLPNYYAIIPASVRYAAISPNAKLLYGEITALSSKEGYCWASNSHFAELYDVNPTTVSEWVHQLVDGGFLKIKITGGKIRHLYLTEVLREKPKGASGKAEHSIKGISIKNIYIEKIPKDEDSVREKNRKEYADTSYYSVFEVFKNPWPLNWKINTAVQRAAKNLLKEKGLEEIQQAWLFYNRHKDEQFCPKIYTPLDLEQKWDKLENYSKKP